MEELLMHGLAAFGAAALILRMNYRIKKRCEQHLARYCVCLPQVIYR